jgi:hypothetical protein
MRERLNELKLSEKLIITSGVLSRRDRIERVSRKEADVDIHLIIQSQSASDSLRQDES